MASLEVTITKKKNRVVVEMDAERFEKLAADFGLFRAEFLSSLGRAERDLKAGRLRKIESLRELRD